MVANNFDQKKCRTKSSTTKIKKQHFRVHLGAFFKNKQFLKEVQLFKYAKKGPSLVSNILHVHLRITRKYGLFLNF